jgi:hypothetical protein
VDGLVGTFRSELGVHAFAQIHSYISTLKKQGLSGLDALTRAFQDSPHIFTYV